jgi:hypothetical protein
MDRGGFFSLLPSKPISDALRSDGSPSGALWLFCNPKESPSSCTISSLSSNENTIVSSCSEDNSERKPVLHDFLGVLGKASEEISSESSTITCCGNKRNEKLNRRNRTVSLDLELRVDPWVIKKIIQESDVGDLSRLLLATKSVNTHIFTLWDAKSIEKVKNGGVPVTVWDSDTMSEHQLRFKQWASGSYVLIEQWKSAFVNRRTLNKGDEIGLYWDPTNSRFNFTILKRAKSDI